LIRLGDVPLPATEKAIKCMPVQEESSCYLQSGRRHDPEFCFFSSLKVVAIAQHFGISLALTANTKTRTYLLLCIFSLLFNA